MKAIIISLLIVGIAALPQNPTNGFYSDPSDEVQKQIVQGITQNNERFVTGSITKAIEDISQGIQDAALDPLHIKKRCVKYSLPVPVIFKIQSSVEELLFTGLSNIVVHDIKYNIFTSRLTFDIRLPRINFSLGKAVKDVTIFGNSFKSYVSGKFAIVGIRLQGNIRLNIGIITGINIRSVDIDFNLGGILSELKIIVQDKDLSKAVNNFLGKVIPETLNDFSKEINQLLEIVVKEFLDAYLYFPWRQNSKE